METILRNKSNVIALFLKILVLPFLIATLMLSSCRSDDDESAALPQQPLVGIWQPYKMMTRATLSTGPFSETTNYTICQQKSRIIFDDDKVGSAKIFNDEGTNCVLQNSFSFNYNYDPVTKVLTTENSDGTTTTGTVVQLTSTDLVYELTTVGEFQGEPNVTVSTTIYTQRTKD